MSRIAAKFTQLNKQGRKALIPFITAGYPDPASCVPLMHALVAGGADIIELGVPFSDPMADGPAIQAASQIAHSLKAFRFQVIRDHERKPSARTHHQNLLILWKLI